GVERRGRQVVILASPGAQILDVAGPFQVFTRAEELFSSLHGGASPIYQVHLVSTGARLSLATSCGLSLQAHQTFRQLRAEIDTLLVAGGGEIENDETDHDVVQWISRCAAKVRRIGSVCTGAMLLARAGLLDGKKATTHRKWCEHLARKYPQVQVDPNPIFVRDGNIYTSAGVTAGM